MDTITERLDTWVEAGLVSPEQAERIASFEDARSEHTGFSPATRGTLGLDGRSDARSPTSSTAAPHRGSRADRDRTSLAEAIGYVGAALALGAIALLLGELWSQLLVGGRLALVGVLTVAVFGAGLALRGAERGAMRRLTSVLFAATVAGVGWFAGVVANDVADLGWAEIGVSVGGSMLVVSAALYLWHSGALLQLATLASALVTVGFALSVSDLQPDPAWYGVAFATIGVAWFVLSSGGWLSPRGLGEVTGALAALLGVQVAAFDGATVPVLVIGVLGAGGLVWLSVHHDRLHYLIVGAIALFVLAPQLVFELFGDEIGAPATLLLVGLLLVLLAVGLGRARREVVRDHTEPPGGAS
ncbi:MAG: hypothetical protein EA340_00545 [Nitriliruptor sp.]|nr:MAG: hypothetical protein EA340_00545 [Nitriliruptor sp.]